jgi:hypothetical protein
MRKIQLYIIFNESKTFVLLTQRQPFFWYIILSFCHQFMKEQVLIITSFAFDISWKITMKNIITHRFEFFKQLLPFLRLRQSYLLSVEKWQGMIVIPISLFDTLVIKVCPLWNKKNSVNIIPIATSFFALSSLYGNCFEYLLNWCCSVVYVSHLFYY